MDTKPSDVMRRWMREVWNEGREATIDELFPHPHRAHGLGDKPIEGAAEFKGFWRTLRATFTDIRLDVLDTVDEGEKCYVRCLATMRFRGKPVTLPGGCVCHVRHGKIVECWNAWDFVTLLTGMGAVPADLVPLAFAGKRLAPQA